MDQHMDSTETAITTGTPLLNNTLQGNDSFKWQVLEDIAFNMETIYLWIYLAVGFPGNCATVITVIKMSPTRSLTVYIAMLAVVDNLAIIDKLLLFVLLDHGVHVGLPGCKILGYFGNFLSTFANWLLVSLSVERFAAVWFPFKIGKRWTFKKSLLAVILLALPLAGMFLHLFWVINFFDDKEAQMMYCAVYKEYEYFMIHIWYWINVMMYALIPCVLLIVFNILIVIGIVKSGKTQMILRGTQGSVKGKSGQDRHRQVTIMMVTAAIALVVLTTPRCVMLILTPYWNAPEGTKDGSVQYLLDTIAFVLCDFTHAINFYVYSFSAKTFRQQFCKLFSCCKIQTETTNMQYFSMSTRS